MCRGLGGQPAQPRCRSQPPGAAPSPVAAGSGRVDLAGTASLTGEQAFKLTANAANFNPASFGDYPAADINADVHAAGHIAPAWKVAADFALRPSRLFNQPLSGNIMPKDGKDVVTSGRLDLEYKIGAHTVRAGSR